MKKREIVRKLIHGGTKVAIAFIPIFGGPINEVYNLISDVMLEKRLQSLENICKNYLNNINYRYDEFVEKTNNLNESSYYNVRRSFRHLLISSPPETVELLCKAMITYILKEDQTIDQLTCEILESLNAQDILALKLIKELLSTEEYQLKIQSKIAETQHQNISVNKKIEFQDRNTIYPDGTVFVADLLKTIKINGKIVNLPENISLSNLCSTFLTSDEDTIHWEFSNLCQSINKMSRLGIFEVEFLTTLGSISTYNIDRFHITLLGQNLLNYIEI